MFGKNEVLAPIHKEQDGSTLMVHSMFSTIQGEGPWTGYPCVFLRLHGCNLKCWFCDTEFEKNKVEDSIDDIVNSVVNVHKKDRVVITGGEPFRQNLFPLVSKLNENAVSVQVETAGTISPDRKKMIKHFGYEGLFDYGNLIVCSPKTSKVHKDIFEVCKDFKYVIKEGETSNYDGLPIYSTQKLGKPKEISRPPNDAQVWLLPMDEQDESLNEANQNHAAQLAMRYNYRLTLQVHKILNLP